jgi:hypothetical protein
MKDTSMKTQHAIFMATLFSTMCPAETATLKLTYENLDFDNSVKKDKGQKYGLELSYRMEKNLYQVAYEKTDTKTFKPPLNQNLHVNKYYFKYTRSLDDMQALTASYATIDDNLMKETDGGYIYGLGYRYGDLEFTQYLSDYKHFNVYQTDVKYIYKKRVGGFKTATAFIGKYIHLQDRESNGFSKNAKENYFTPGIKFHAHYEDYHFGAGAFFGKRIFAVMNDGFRVQHHAMEFNETYMVGVGKHFDNLDLTLKYVYQNATEIPIDNENVKVKNVMLQLRYRF